MSGLQCEQIKKEMEPKLHLPEPEGNRLLQLGLGGIDNSRKAGRVIYREISHDLTIERDFGLFETVNKPAVGETIIPRCGIDSGDPESTEIPLLDAPVTISVIERTVDCFRSRTEQFTSCATVTLGEF